MKFKTNYIHQGNALGILKNLPDESVDSCITSPPYWGLRNYNTSAEIWDADDNCRHEWREHVKLPSGGMGSKNANVGANRNDNANRRDKPTITNFCTKCPAWRGELGSEPTYDLFIKHLCDIFDEIKRVLKKDGTCFVNIGDTYGGTNPKAEGDVDPKYPKGRNVRERPPNQSAPSKCLLQIPARFAIEMTNRGWILRNEIIWHKPNAMPQSVTDRFSVDYEKVYFFAKSKRYYFEQQLEKALWADDPRAGQGRTEYNGKYQGDEKTQKGFVTINPEGRNKRSVWSINTKPYKDAHFAIYPEKLIVPMIKSGSRGGGAWLLILSLVRALLVWLLKNWAENMLGLN